VKLKHEHESIELKAAVGVDRSAVFKKLIDELKVFIPS
jgi:hypothetical protein